MASLETKGLVEGALFSAITVLLALIGSYLPLFGIVMILVLPLPIIVVGVRQGTKIGILTTILSAILLGMLINFLMSLMVLFGFGLIGVVLGAAFEEEFSSTKIIMIAIIVSTISTLLILGVNFYLLDFSIEPIINTVLQQYKSLGIDQATQQELIDMFVTIAPALILTASAINGLVNYYIAINALNRLGYEYEEPPPLVEWRFPKYLTVGFILGILLINTNIGKNIYMVFNFIFFIQGLAIAAYYLKRFNISNTLQKIILAILVILPVNQILSFLGILDTWFDYRKLDD
ncbi:MULTISPECIES: YybS family protein [unclassified Candidatus Frackibacter]|uniref:YybS family protein n=1 Tax=unclassified Candidatus Frackibacter TaxID=2648818 RepID=UPI000796B42A|nr:MULTISPECIES: DUF2232 domain-containing protein [unclassified Candidatus Frackibacter]KXS40953.1 MAG: hypothetical protein AWU54_1793 [Candidatus Frackibacter sp. T328-2]SDC44370.1 Uncharacterized conserved protein YybS, DUF2232 family [Candidatus Frackibacter sp. WG11]SEM64507.1 Uncharacterized conserved protein YybS, DUF2232 family [Candidatus Frackibacter sp. WG12]SFL68098.1 Uncharacterized conserved protein YybS, DUF2232 family [Candidatus Frackibacter sp. WG13]